MPNPFSTCAKTRLVCLRTAWGWHRSLHRPLCRALLLYRAFDRRFPLRRRDCALRHSFRHYLALRRSFFHRRTRWRRDRALLHFLSCSPCAIAAALWGTGDGVSQGDGRRLAHEMSFKCHLISVVYEDNYMQAIRGVAASNSLERRLPLADCAVANQQCARKNKKPSRDLGFLS